MPVGPIAGLRARCDNIGKVLPMENFEAGQSVEIHSSSWVNFIITLAQMTSGARIWVLLDLLVKATRVQVDRQKIQAPAPAVAAQRIKASRVF